MADMNSPLFDIDQPGMQVEVDSYKPGTGFAWQQMFPLKYTRKFDLKGIEGEDGIPVSADRVAFNSKAPKKTRKKVGTWNAMLGKISVSREKDEIEVNEYLDAQALAASNTEDRAAAEELVSTVYDDLKFCNDGMDARNEIEAMQVGSLGKRIFNSTIDGDMVEQEEINFNVPTENFKGASVVWSDYENADGLADIAAGAKFIASKGRKKPLYAIMTQTMFDHLCSQKKTINRVAGVVLRAVGLESTDDVTLDSINRYMRTKGAPQVLVIDPYVDVEKKDGSHITVKPWNEPSVVLTPSVQMGWTHYKTVPQVKNTAALQVYGAYYKMTRYSQVNPTLEVTMAEAYLQPALINRKSLVYINALKTTWNEGKA